jgi:hypothetical protein
MYLSAHQFKLMNFITGQNEREETTQNTTVTSVLRVQGIRATTQQIKSLTHTSKTVS